MRVSISTGRKLMWVILTALVVAASLPGTLYARDQQFEEIVVEFEIKQLLRQDIFVQYSDDGIYLPLLEILRLLDVYVETDFQRLRFSGHFLSKDDGFEIDFRRLEANAGENHVELSPSDFVVGPEEVYLAIKPLNRIFDLDLQFDFSNLLVRMSLNEEFPSYKKLKRRRAHENLTRQTVSQRDVRRLPRRAPYFGAGVLDWALSASPVGGGGEYFDFALGSMVMRGDLKVSASGNMAEGFDTDNLSYRWHYYNEDGRVFSQLDAGHVFTTGVFSQQLEGVTVTNRPQIPRKFYQTVQLSDYVGEGWEVELYVNNRLSDFVYTDADGRYDFSVDIFYGTSEILLKMYGPNGEIRSERQYVDVPYNLVPKNSLEYTVAAGVAENGREESRQVTQASAFYGVSNRLTLGVSADVPVEQTDDVSTTVAGEATCRVFGNLNGNVSVAPGYASGFSLEYGHPSFLNAFVDFTKYTPGSHLNRLDQEYEIQFSFSSPLKIGQHRFPVRYSLSVNKFPQFNSINMNYGINASLLGVTLNYLGRARILKYTDRSIRDISSEIFASPLLLRRFRPQLRMTYDHSSNSIETYGVQINQRLFRNGQFSVSFERNEMTKANQIKATFRLFSGFADFTTRATSTAGYTSVAQVQRGSVRYDHEGGRLLFDRRNGVGSGAAVVRPFLDGNYNGVLDEDEELLTGLRAKFRGGRQRLAGGQVYYYDGLRAYDSYLIQIDEYSLDNPLLKPTHENYEVICNPNVVTAIEVPLVIGSEVNGHVRRQMEGITTGLGGAKIMLLNLANESVLELTSFSNGEFFYLGLVPGSYRAYIDPEQLNRLGYVADPPTIDFVVEPAEGGTAIENVDFILTSQ